MVIYTFNIHHYVEVNMHLSVSARKKKKILQRPFYVQIEKAGSIFQTEKCIQHRNDPNMIAVAAHTRGEACTQPAITAQSCGASE